MQGQVRVLRRTGEVQRHHAHLDLTTDIELLLHAILLRFDHRVGGLELLATAGQGQMGAHPGLQDRRRDRLDDIVDRAELQAAGLVLGLTHRRDEDHRDAGGDRVGLEPPTDLVTIHPRHHDIEQDQVRRMGRDHRLQGLLATARDHQAVIGLQQPRDDIDVGGLVIDDQDSGAGFHNFEF